MSEVYDKNKHGDEFRLRLLVTNACDRSCSFCLNDFQPKPHPLATYLDPAVAVDYIRAYSSFVRKNCKHVPLINISGGEPGLHPDLLEIVEACSKSKAHLMLNTNGLVFKHRDWYKIAQHVGHLRIHVHPGEFIPYNQMGVRMPMSYQAVVTKDMTFYDADKLVQYYGGRGSCVKFFEDFYGDDALHAKYKEMIRDLRERSTFNIEARFTGAQVNRGLGCQGCQSKCITLKALWLFPDGSPSPCPQHVQRVFRDDQHEMEHVSNTYNFHRTNCHEL